MPIPKSKIPQFVRQCYERARKASKDQRDAEIERLKFYIGGELQWRESELQRRKAQHRAIITINKCKPAVDQIEGDIRMNPPGPEVHPVGNGADKDTADIWAGILREVEYRSRAHAAYSIAGRHEAASGYGVIELATEWSGNRTFDQRVVINPVEDPQSIYFDPASRKLNRADAGWAVRVKSYNRPDYIAAFGDNRRVLKPRMYQQAMGWIQDAVGFQGEMAQINDWTGVGEGPFFVAEMYYDDVEIEVMRRYSDLIDRFDDEYVPPGVHALEGDGNKRDVPRHTIRKWICDALETLDETTWPGTRIPWFAVLGPEIWIDGKLYRLSLISTAIDPQRGLNYAATTAVEIGGTSSKAPWIGWKGQFDDPKWQTANNEMWAYLEVTPKHAVDPTTGQSQLLSAPQRNSWEAPIQWLLQLSAYFSDSIKAVTAIYDPSLGATKGNQSGTAIAQLRSESSIGNFSYVDNLHLVIGDVYQEIINVSKSLLSGPRAVTIVRPDSKHESVLINQIFEKAEDPESGRPRKPNNIVNADYSVRVTAGPSFQTRQEEAVAMLLDFFKANPQAGAVPGVAAKFLRIVGQGNPEVEAMADLLAPDSNGDQTPAQMGQALQKSQAETQQLQQALSQLRQAFMAKLPEIEAKKWVATVNAIAGIREAEIRSGVDRADQDLRAFEHISGMAHETASQGVDQQHQAGMAQQQQQAQQQAAQQEQQSGNEEPQQ